MPLELSEITDEADFDELITCECVSYQQPLNTFFHLFRHDWTEAGFKELRDRQVREWKGDKTARWLKVVDTDVDKEGGKGKGMIVGAAKWNKFTEAPYNDREKAKHPLEADWWPEGEPREFANKLLDCFLCPRWDYMNRPHMLLAMLFTHPSHRRRGIGRQLINWGTQLADSLNIEAFIEATEDGKPTYEACGYYFVGTEYWESAKQAPSKKWRELEVFLNTPIHVYLMWRPKGGRWVEGEGKEGGTRFPVVEEGEGKGKGRMEMSGKGVVSWAR